MIVRGEQRCTDCGKQIGRLYYCLKGGKVLCNRCYWQRHWKELGGAKSKLLSMGTEMVPRAEYDALLAEAREIDRVLQLRQKELEVARARIVQLEEDSEEWVPRARLDKMQSALGTEINAHLRTVLELEAARVESERLSGLLEGCPECEALQEMGERAVAAEKLLGDAIGELTDAQAALSGADAAFEMVAGEELWGEEE